MKDLPFFSCIFGKFVLSLYPDKITIKNYMTMAKYAVIKETTIYDDYDVNVDEWRECYEEHCEINDITPEEETPYDFIYDMLNMEWEDMFCGIKHSKYNDECVVLGCLGLWFGNRDITPTRESCLTDAIKHCVEGCVDEYINGITEY